MTDTGGSAAGTPAPSDADFSPADRGRVDFNLVVFLHVLTQEESLVHAAERLHISVPTARMTLARARRLLEDPILVHHGRTTLVTPRARSLARRAGRALEVVREIEQLGPMFDPEVSERTFIVSASDYVISELVAPLTMLIEREAPRVRVDFRSLPVDTQLEADDLLRSDIVIGPGDRGLPSVRQVLFSDRFVCVADRRNPLVRDGALSVADFERLEQVDSTVGGDTAARREIQQKWGVSFRADIMVNGILPIPYLICGTDMIGFVPERLARRLEHELGLHVVRTPFRFPVVAEEAHCHPLKAADPSASWLVRTLRRAATVAGIDEVVDTVSIR